MRYLVRISLPDRPGALAAVATALAAAAVDVVSFTVIERVDDLAVDEVGVDGPVSMDVLQRTLEQVPGVAVEAISAVAPAAAGLTATGLAADLAEQREPSYSRLVEGLLSAIGADWAVAVGDSSAGLQTLAASAAAPTVPPAIRLPFLPLQRACRLPQAVWMPHSWCPEASHERAELCAAPLAQPTEVVLVARSAGPRFRQPELDRIEDITRVAVAAYGGAHLPV